MEPPIILDESEQMNSVRKQPSTWPRWIAASAVSALVGSAMTLCVVIPVLRQTNTSAATSQAQSSAATVQETSYQPTDSGSITAAVQRVTPAVVGVLNLQQNRGQLQEAAVGSGVIFSKDGYIVTNNHVVEGADKVEVVLNGKQHVTAKVVGVDPFTDLAVLQIDSKDIQAKNIAVFGDSSQVQPGQTAIAIGNPNGMDFADTVTSGIISATARTMPVQDEQSGQVIGQETVLQTDAAINPGNSGGPLCNTAGQVVGITSAKIASQGFEGMGFAIPSNEVKQIVDEILKTGHAAHPEIGIEAESVTDLDSNTLSSLGSNVTQGVYVAQVDSDNARTAGLQAGDVITGLGGKSVTDVTSLQTALSSYSPGQAVDVTVTRGQKVLHLQVTLGTKEMSHANSGH